MNRRLSAWLLCGTLLVWPLTARGQKTNSHIAPSTIVNTPSLHAEDPSGISRGTGPSVSTRELSIPERARNAYKRGIDRLAKNDPKGSLVHLQRALGSEEARFRAGLRPPPKLPVHISCRQLSRRLSDARKREKELNRASE